MEGGSGVLGIKCAMRMKDGSWYRIEVSKKKERKVEINRPRCWYLDSTRQFHHSSWFSARVVFFPNRYCAKPSQAFFPCRLWRRTQPCLLRPRGRKSNIAIIASYSDFAVTEGFPASIHFEVNSRYIYIVTPSTSPASGEASE
jgi:hypothetical protein